jgi:hypothetical protein
MVERGEVRSGRTSPFSLQPWTRKTDPPGWTRSAFLPTMTRSEDAWRARSFGPVTPPAR